MDECYENGTSRRFTNLAHSRQLATLELTRREAGKSESAKCGQRPESAPTPRFRSLVKLAISNSYIFNNCVTAEKHEPSRLRIPWQRPLNVAPRVGRRNEEEYVQSNQSISHPQENAGLTHSIDYSPGTECFARICRFATEKRAHSAHRRDFRREHFL